MKFLIEKLCVAVMVNDFLQFSYAYEGSKKSFKDYCENIFGVDIYDLSIVSSSDYNSEDILNFNKAFEQANVYMPLLIENICAVKTHFIDYNEEASVFFEPSILFNNNINCPSCKKYKVDGLIKEAISSIKKILFEKCGFETLFIALENYCTYFSVDGGKTSFFEFLKTKAGHASILLHCLLNKSKEHSLLICSFDFLGIKEFKFAEYLNNDLTLMRMASLYIDIFRENVLDEFLEIVGLTRANVVFCGGRHIHMYLPATEKMRDIIDSFIRKLNNWCVENYNTELYVSYGYAETSFLDLKFKKKPHNYYLNLFEQIATIKAKVESVKYSPNNILFINASHKRSFVENRKINFITQLKKLYQNLFKMKQNAITISTAEDGIPIFPGKFISLKESSYLEINRRYLDKSSESRFGNKDIGIWFMYHKMNMTFDSISNDSRVGVFRVDIDDFRKKMLSYGPSSEKEIPDSSFKMMLSKEFALFLRYYLHILTDHYENIAVLHEGADDVFVVGEIEALLNFSYELSFLYQKYTNNKMTISGGFTIYKFADKFLDAANEAQELMNKSKTVDGKNAITILNSSTTYKWNAVDLYEIKKLLTIS